MPTPSRVLNPRLRSARIQPEGHDDPSKIRGRRIQASSGAEHREVAVVEVYVPGREEAKPRSIGDVEFAGMWAHRDDIADGVTYVDSLRDNLRR
jgi:hypothetical protein